MKFHLRWIFPAVVTALVTFGSFAVAQNYNPLPDTGQTTCYDTAGTVITCPAPGQPWHGQDAQYHGPAPAYQDNGNGTVTDVNTELVWLKETVDVNGDGLINTSDRLMFQEAIDYCSDLSFAESNDWRLPTFQELQSIVDFGKYEPAINLIFLSELASYWSATIFTNGANSAWGIDFNDGREYSYSNVASLYVRCVRTGPPVICARNPSPWSACSWACDGTKVREITNIYTCERVEEHCVCGYYCTNSLKEHICTK